MNTQRHIAQILLDTGAVKLSPNTPFTFSSGIKSPIYCDNRELLAFPDKRNSIVNAFLQCIKDSFLSADVIAGTATAGIPWASFIAQSSCLPLSYIRSSVKQHGRAKVCEGASLKGKHVLLIEDLISTGGSVLKAKNIALEEGALHVDILAIFSYNLPESKNILTVQPFILSSFEVLVELAREKHLFSVEEIQKLYTWQKERHK
ncbi:MAG: orotate phosphoribosyltransferase [Desulfovibrionaceae bacterium]